MTDSESDLFRQCSGSRHSSAWSSLGEKPGYRLESGKSIGGGVRIFNTVQESVETAQSKATSHTQEDSRSNLWSRAQLTEQVLL